MGHKHYLTIEKFILSTVSSLINGIRPVKQNIIKVTTKSLGINGAFLQLTKTSNTQTTKSGLSFILIVDSQLERR